MEAVYFNNTIVIGYVYGPKSKWKNKGGDVK